MPTIIDRVKDIDNLFSDSKITVYKPENNLEKSLRGILYRYKQKTNHFRNYSSSPFNIITAYQLNSTVTLNDVRVRIKNYEASSNIASDYVSLSENDYVIVNKNGTLSGITKDTFDDLYEFLIIRDYDTASDTYDVNFIKIYGTESKSIFQKNEININFYAENRYDYLGFNYFWTITFPSGESKQFDGVKNIELKYTLSQLIDNNDILVGEYQFSLQAKGPSNISISLEKTFKITREPTTEIVGLKDFYNSSQPIISFAQSVKGDPVEQYSWSLQKNFGTTNLIPTVQRNISSPYYKHNTNDVLGLYKLSSDVKTKKGANSFEAQSSKLFRIVESLNPVIETTSTGIKNNKVIFSAVQSTGCQFFKSFQEKDNINWVISADEKYLYLSAYLNFDELNNLKYYWSINDALAQEISFSEENHITIKCELKDLIGGSNYTAHLNILNQYNSGELVTSISISILEHAEKIKEVIINSSILSNNRLLIENNKKEKFTWDIFLKQSANSVKSIFVTQVSSPLPILEYSFQEEGYYTLLLNIEDSVGRQRNSNDHVPIRVFSEPVVKIQNIPNQIYNYESPQTINLNLDTFNDPKELSINAKTWDILQSRLELSNDEIILYFAKERFKGTLTATNQQLYLKKSLSQFIVSDNLTLSALKLSNFSSADSKIKFSNPIRLISSTQNITEIEFTNIQASQIFIYSTETVDYYIKFEYITPNVKVTIYTAQYLSKPELDAKFQHLLTISDSRSETWKSNKVIFYDNVKTYIPKISWNIQRSSDQQSFPLLNYNSSASSFVAIEPQGFVPEEQKIGKEQFQVSVQIESQRGFYKIAGQTSFLIWSKPKAYIEGDTNIIEGASIVLDGKKSFIPIIQTESKIISNHQKLFRRSLYHVEDFHFAINNGSLGTVPDLFTEETKKPDYHWELLKEGVTAPVILSNSISQSLNLDSGKYQISLQVKSVGYEFSEKSVKSFEVYAQADLNILIKDCNGTPLIGILELGKKVKLEASFPNAYTNNIFLFHWEIKYLKSKKESLINSPSIFLSGESLDFKFDKEGFYQISLKAQDSTQTIRTFQTIEVAQTNTLNATINSHFYTLNSQKYIQLDACKSTGSNNLSYKWELLKEISNSGDPDFPLKRILLTGEKAVFAVEAGSTYTIILTISDQSSNTSTDTLEIVVS